MWYFKSEWMIIWVTLAYTIVSTLALVAIAIQVWLMKDTAKRQLRAYLTVTIGSAIYQERRSAEDGGDLKFESDPHLVNTGQTPARKIQFKARAEILPSPLPVGINLAEGMDEGVGYSMLGPRQNATMTAIVSGFCQDSEVEVIKRGTGAQALYVWGLITYEDVFGDAHHTRFCQRIFWDLKDNVRGHYVPGRNDAD